MRRFVLLYHECPPGFTKPSHWDFMLEAEGVLLTWELRNLPRSWQEVLGRTATRDSQTVVAKRLADHRLDYLTYEGSLTNDRGTVKRVAEGTFKETKINDNSFNVALHGQTIQGIAVLTRTAETEEWRLSVGD